MAMNIYKTLGVSKGAPKEDIIKSYAKRKNALYQARDNGIIETTEFYSKLDELEDAYAIIMDPDRLNAYEAGNHVKSTGARKGKKNGKNNIFHKVAIGTCVVALATSIVGCGIIKHYRNKSETQSSQVKSYQEMIDTTEKQTEALTEPVTEKQTEAPTEPVTEKQTETPTEPVTEKQTEAPTEPVTEKQTEPIQTPVDSTIPEMVNYGDAKDDALVTEKANKLLAEMNAAGLYNMGTNAQYTIDEIKTLIQYVNGAYKPANEDEAYTLVNELLNFIIAPLNSEHVLFAVQYQGGEDSFKDTVQGYIDNFHRVNIVDNMLLGNSTAGPYLHWIEDQYYNMLCTTDREKCTEIYDSVMQSLADMIYGDGFTLNGKVYDKNDFLGLDRVNAGNILQMIVNMTEPLRTTKTKDTFTVHNKLISANPEENEVTVDYLKITEQFNALCEDDLAPIAVDDEGLLLIDQTDGKNFAYINQVNTINCALKEFYGKGNAYENVYQKTLN